MKINNQAEKIAITGGKGGTGKSAMAVLLANQLAKQGKKLILCDCDVECPNDHLLLGQKLGKPREKVSAEFPELDKSKCDRCGLCADACRSNAIIRAPGEYPVFIRDLCSGCGACWIVCPKRAIRPVKEETGQIFVNQINRNFYLVTGQANPGLEETGPVVAKAKKFALSLKQELKADFILFDTAAGIHCPVVAALLDCDAAYAVTEPTPMGAYDLDLILNLCRQLKIPATVILNQADLGSRARIDKIIRKFKTKIELEMPYSSELAAKYSRGQLLDYDLRD